MSLARYRAKRDLQVTPEPKAVKRAGKGTLRFVVQRHKASHLHYDFRLEMDGVLKSWAVPKGPSLSPDDKRLAMMVEDHPYAYKDFKGVIPEGHYGAGIVEIWDQGTYEPLREHDVPTSEKELLKDLRQGAIKFTLHGRKLKGSFALVKLKDGRTPNAWLLIKHRDAFAVDGPYDSEAETPRSSPINKALAREGKAVRAKARSGGVVRKAAAPAARPAPVPRAARALGKAAKLAHYIHPMLCKQRADAFDDPAWLFEIKWDGYRAIAETGPRLRLYSRNGLSFQQAYPTVWNALGRIKQRLVLDGEIVALDRAGKPSFQLLQNVPEHPGTPVVYQVFDLLEVDGERLDALPLIERKARLRRVLRANGILRYSDHVVGDGQAFFQLTKERGLEGMIAKRADAPYLRGTRSSNWLKIKHHAAQEVVIGGYTAPRGGRQHFGSLLLGAYEGNTLHYIGHTGTGFDHATLRSLFQRMQPLVRATSPFAGHVKPNAPAVWLKPHLVANVSFTEWTKDGSMRHPVFQGLRVDKAARDVHRERPTTMAKQKQTTSKRAATKAAADPANERTVQANGQAVHLTNQHKVFWPKEGFTKGDVVDYYDRMSKWILPHLKDRPQSLKRNPGGIADPGFYQKDAGADTPEWVRTVRVPSKSRGGPIDYILCNDRAALLYLANLGCIELNPWPSRVQHLDKPDHVVMDLDPGPRSTFDDVVEAALAVHTLTTAIGAKAFCKTSGASGLHVYLPTHARYTYTELAPFMALLAQQVQALLPTTTTLERSIAKRNGRLYLDHLQNRQGQTLASVYSIRPVEGATVSTPLEWKEVRPGLDRTQFTLRTVPQRVQRKGDLFRGVHGAGLDLRKCLRKLEALHP